MNGEGVSQSCVRNPQCLTYSKHKIFALNWSAAQTATFSELSSTRCLQNVRTICQWKGVRCSALKNKYFFGWMLCVYVRWKLLMHEAHCRKFPKHCETYALNIEEVLWNGLPQATESNSDLIT